MKRLRVGINGFGRIGRALCRILLTQDRHDVVTVNDINPDDTNLAYLFEYDSLYGRWPEPARAEGGRLHVGARAIALQHHEAVDAARWDGVDVVIDASGVAQNVAAARRLPASVKLCLVTNAAKDVDYTLVMGVNHEGFDLSRHRIASTSICDANACAPALQALDESFGISHGFITTLHPWLSYQNLLDGRPESVSYPGKTYEHYTLGRSSVGSLIPKPTTVVAACEQVLPRLAGSLQCFSYRVPTAIVSSADISLCLRRPATQESLIAALRDWSERCRPHRVFEFCDKPLVSLDFLRNEHSAVVDSRWFMVAPGTGYVKIVLWYDNEWGYASKVAEAISLAACAWPGSASAARPAARI